MDFFTPLPADESSTRSHRRLLFNKSQFIVNFLGGYCSFSYLCSKITI